METIKTDIFDRYSGNLVELQDQLQKVKNDTLVINQKQLQAQDAINDGMKTAVQKVTNY